MNSSQVLHNYFEILQRADLGITDLTMTSDRESAVDFTIPFMNLGMRFLLNVNFCCCE